jgi:hypothetical protein
LTLTSSGVDFITLTGAGWTVDQWKGYFVKTADGQYRTIQSNSVDTLVPTIDFSPAPSNIFDIVRPETTITSSSTRVLVFANEGLGYTNLQRIFFSGAARLYFRGKTSNYATGIISTCSSTYAFYAQNATVAIWEYLYDPLNPSALLSAYKYGCSFLNGDVHFSDCSKNVTAYGLIANTCNLYGSYVNAIRRGCRFKFLNFDGCTVLASGVLGDATDRKNIVDGSAGVGVLFNNISGNPNLAADSWEIKNCASHGMEIINSNVKFSGAVDGSGNGGAGVYAHDNSTVTIKDGSPPTLTGTVGDCSTDGTTERTTWAEVDADSPITDLYESTTIKEVV